MYRSPSGMISRTPPRPRPMIGFPLHHIDPEVFFPGDDQRSRAGVQFAEFGARYSSAEFDGGTGLFFEVSIFGALADNFKLPTRGCK